MRKFLMFSVLFVLFCFTVLSPTKADAAMNFDKMKFYEGGGDNLTDYSQRVYANKFPKSAVRYIYGEVNFFNYSSADELRRIVLKYYKPDGTLFGETDYTGVVKSIWTTNWMSAGLGWSAPGNWQAGQYRVEAYLDYIYVATGYFEVYDDKSVYNQNDVVKPEDIVKDWDYGVTDGNKSYDLYYDKKILKTPAGNVLLNILLDYTDWGREKYLKNIPNAKKVGYVLEINVNLNQYRALWEIYSDSKGNIISEKKYDNPQWLPSVKGKMSDRWMEIAKELSR